MCTQQGRPANNEKVSNTPALTLICSVRRASQREQGGEQNNGEAFHGTAQLITSTASATLAIVKGRPYSVAPRRGQIWALGGASCHPSRWGRPEQCLKSKRRGAIALLAQSGATAEETIMGEAWEWLKSLDPTFAFLVIINQ